MANSEMLSQNFTKKMRQALHDIDPDLGSGLTETDRINVLEAAVNNLAFSINQLSSVTPSVGSTPVMAQTYATGKISLAGNPSPGDALMVGGKTYKFVSALTEGGEVNEILICATNVPNDTAKAIEYAINASTGVGHTDFYGADTPANEDVVATADGAAVSLTCENSSNAELLIGKTGNDIPLAKNANNLTVTPFAGGLDITEAAAGKIIVGNGAIYVAKGICTATVNNWFVISGDGA